MQDETMPGDVPGPAEPAERPEREPESERRPRRSLFGVVVLAAAIALVLWALSLARGCGSAPVNVKSASGGVTIEAVPGMEELPGVVSVALEKGHDIEQVLGAADVPTLNAIQLAEGYFVIEVEKGSEDEVIAALERLGNVHDAGRVYDDDR